MNNPKIVSPDVPHIVMVTHGDARVEALEQSIPAVLETEHPFTLTMVANAPGPDTKTYLRKMKPHLHKLILNRKNWYFPHAFNQGWKVRPDFRYCVVLGDDLVAVDRDWLRKLVDIVDHCPEVGIVGHSVEGTYPVQAVGYPPNPRCVQVQPSNLGGCYLIPRRTWELCGYLNEDLGPYAEEDALYGWKVRHSGLLCAYFDHTDLGRSMKWLNIDRDPEYVAWKDGEREKAIPKREQAKREYLAGRPLNT